MYVYLVYKYLGACSDVECIFTEKFDAQMYAEQMNEKFISQGLRIVEERQVHESLETVNI